MREIGRAEADLLNLNVALLLAGSGFPPPCIFRNIGCYHGGVKNIHPITIATYDIDSKSRYARKLFERERWLVVFDEAHHVPPEVWRRTVDILSRARFGLTATSVRSDGKSNEIFMLLGRTVTST